MTGKQLCVAELGYLCVAYVLAVAPTRLSAWWWVAVSCLAVAAIGSVVLFVHGRRATTRENSTSDGS